MGGMHCGAACIVLFLCMLNAPFAWASGEADLDLERIPPARHADVDAGEIESAGADVCEYRLPPCSGPDLTADALPPAKELEASELPLDVATFDCSRLPSSHEEIDPAELPAGPPFDLDAAALAPFRPIILPADLRSRPALVLGNLKPTAAWAIPRGGADRPDVELERVPPSPPDLLLE